MKSSPVPAAFFHAFSIEGMKRLYSPSRSTAVYQSRDFIGEGVDDFG
jgi:hypothetical protein